MLRSSWFGHQSLFVGPSPFSVVPADFPPSKPKGHDAFSSIVFSVVLLLSHAVKLRTKLEMSRMRFMLCGFGFPFLVGAKVCACYVL